MPVPPRFVEAEKLSASIVQSNGTKLLRTLAEKEFEKQFTNLLRIAQKPIYLKKAAILNSPILKRIVEVTQSKSLIVVEDIAQLKETKGGN